MTEKSKIETAIDYIAKHGNARTPAIAETLGITEKNVRPMLDPAIRTGYLVSCQVQVHTPDGIRRMSEYRLSSTVSDSKVSWKDFRIKNGTSAEKTASPTAKSAPTISSATPVPEDPADAVCQAIPPTIPTLPLEQDKRAMAQADKSLFLLGSDGCLHIEAAGITFQLTRDETHHLGMFMDGTSGFWRYSRSEVNANA